MSGAFGHALEAYRGVDAAIFGATGFIGRWLCRALAGVDARPVLIVRDGAAGEELRRELHSGVVMECDVEDPGHVARLIDTLNPTITFNLAGYGVDRAERDDAKMFAVNTRFVEALCSALAGQPAKPWGGQRLIQAGTQLEYGPVTGVVHERLEPRPDTAYGCSKLEATRTLLEYIHTHGLRGVSARLFTVFGPGEHPHRLLPSLLESAASGSALDLTSGEQRLDFTYVEDVAEGLMRLGCCSAGAGGVVNLARGQLVAVREFAEQAAHMLAMPPALLRFGRLPPRPEEMRYSGVSNARLRALTGWTPPRDVVAGIRRTIEVGRRVNAHT